MTIIYTTCKTENKSVPTLELNKQGRVKCSCHVPFQQSQHREQSRRRADKKKKTEQNITSYPK